MIRPLEMSLLKISIHKSQIPLFLNEIPKFRYFSIREFKESTKSKYSLRREKRILSNEMEILSHKLNEIEENILYLMQQLEIDPDKVKKPSETDKYQIEDETIEGLIDQLHETTENESRRLKGYFNDITRYTEELEYNDMLLNAFQWLQLYNINSESLHIFKHLEFQLIYIDPTNFNSFQIALEHEDIPFVLQSKKIGTKFVVFFFISNPVHHESIQEMIRGLNAKEIENLEDFLTPDGLKYDTIEEDIKFCKERIERANLKIEDAKKNTIKIRAYQEILENIQKYIAMEEQFHATSQNQIVHLEAFVPTRDQDEISTRLLKIFQTKIKIIATPIARSSEGPVPIKNQSKDLSENSLNEENKERKPILDEDVKVPSLVVPSKIFKPFKLLVDLYGTTNYSELDPTPIIAFTYPFLFGLMFGDVGHGLILILAGLLLIFLKRTNKRSGMYDFGFLLVWLGAFAVLAGFLYGEIFGNELIINGTHVVLFANPLHNIILVFKAAILIGVIHINLGWALSMVNHFLKKRIYTAFVDPFAKIILLSLGTYLIFHWGFDLAAWLAPPYPILLATLPAIILVVGKPLGKIIFRIKYLNDESVGGLIGESTIDVGETYLSILSNVASYSRLLALSMAHMGLMLIVSTMVELVQNLSWIVPIILIFGNLFVIVLESVLAAIHALRLHLYEFFGKFYLADGVAYTNTNIDFEYSNIKFLKAK